MRDAILSECRQRLPVIIAIFITVFIFTLQFPSILFINRLYK